MAHTVEVGGSNVSWWTMNNIQLSKARALVVSGFHIDVAGNVYNVDGVRVVKKTSWRSWWKPLNSIKLLNIIMFDLNPNSRNIIMLGGWFNSSRAQTQMAPATRPHMLKLKPVDNSMGGWFGFSLNTYPTACWTSEKSNWKMGVGCHLEADKKCRRAIPLDSPTGSLGSLDGWKFPIKSPDARFGVNPGLLTWVGSSLSQLNWD